MTRPRFLSLDNVLGLHRDTIAMEGGLPGVRDLGLLESAVMMPQQQFGGDYLHPDLAAMAAAYLYHLAANHPFMDGNKRVAAMAAFVFLDVNGHDLTASPDAFEAVVMGVANGTVTKAGVTQWMAEFARARWVAAGNKGPAS